jgi:hypothetical protein
MGLEETRFVWPFGANTEVEIQENVKSLERGCFSSGLSIEGHICGEVSTFVDSITAV